MKRVYAAAAALVCISGGAPAGTLQGTWLSDDGRTYQASMQVQGKTIAKVQGCALKALCKKHTWTRTN